MSELLLDQLQRLREKKKGRQIDVIETGSIRDASDEYRENDGWSTLTFARHAAAHGGNVISIDLDTSIAAKVLADHGLRDVVLLWQGYSVDALAQLLRDGTRADLILLDSANDAQLILHEFYVARCLLERPGVLLIDDTGGGDSVKGHAVIRALADEGESFEVLQRNGSTYSTGVLVWENV